jgi:GNAT superfamily N-acetyltransferase
MDARPLDPTSERELSSVLDLFQLVYGFELPRAVYRWRFLDNPFGAPLVTLLWNGQTLAGHYAASPMRSWWRGEVQSAQSMTTMTHPAYRNRGVFTSLAEDLYARMTALGYQMIWGLPNTQSHYGFTTKLGWRDIAVMFTMTRVLGEQDGKTDALDELVELPSGVDDLFARSDDGRLYPSARDASYMRWRYVGNPTVRYRFFAGDDVLLVAKDYTTSPTTRSLELVDYLYARAAKRFGALVRATCAWAQARGYTTVRTWMATTDAAFGELEKLGFAPREPLAYFGGRTLGGFVIPDAHWSHAGFGITMGDSDNY